MLILDLWGISFHAVVVFGRGKNLLFKSILGLCAGLFFPNFFVHFWKNWQQRRHRLKLTDPLKGGWVSRPRHVSVCRWPKVHSDEVEMRFFAWLLRWKWWTPRLSPSYLSSQTVHLSRKSKMYSTWVSLTDFLTFLLV